MTENIKVIRAKCECGTAHRRFTHTCKASGVSRFIHGCPACDDYCPDCNKDAPPPDNPDHLCTIDEVIHTLKLIRDRFGNVGVMICFDGDTASDEGHTLAATEYLPVNRVALDEDEPDNVFAILCVASGNHPFGGIRRMRAEDWNAEKTT